MAAQKYISGSDVRPNDDAEWNNLQSTRSKLSSQPFDPWTHWAIYIGLVPLLGWDAVNVFLLAVACKVHAAVAWIPALSTSGIMLASSRIAMRSSHPHVKKHASWLAALGIVLGVGIAATHGALPDDFDQPHWAWMALIYGLPVIMGGLLYHIYALATTSHEQALAEQALAEQAQRQTELDAENARLQRIADDETTQRAREGELAHARNLAELAKQKADAEQQAADALARKADAEQALRERVATAARGPRAVIPKPQGSPHRRPSKQRDAAIAVLIDRHRAGDDITKITAAELDRAIGANGYSKYKSQWREWITQVLAHEQGAA